MANNDGDGTTFNTPSMADILLTQDQLEDAARVIRSLEGERPDDPRVRSLRERLDRRLGAGEVGQEPTPESGADRVELEFTGGGLGINWELTPAGLDIAKRRVRYSGKSIIRLFTAHPGPRGIRTTTRDLVLERNCARMDVAGVAIRSCHTAAVGFLGHNGHFVPMARALPISSFPR